MVTESTGIETEIESCSKAATEENEDQTDLNVSTGSLPALSEDDDEVDQDEESLHEPFANSTFATSEIKESTAVRKSPSILKRKRSSTDPNDACIGYGTNEPETIVDTDGPGLVIEGRVSESFPVIGLCDSA